MFLVNICSNLYYGFFLKTLIKLLKKLISDKSFLLKDHNDIEYQIGKKNINSQLVLKILNKKIYSKLVLCPGLYFGEAYMSGDIEIRNGTVSNFLEIILLNAGKNKSIFKEGCIKKSYSNIKNFLKKNNIINSKKNVAHHYDISDDLYKLFLDKRMQYSCAYFNHNDDSLEIAQKNKINLIIRKLKIDSSCKILDIGSGWGGLSIEIAKQTGAKVLGITLSKNQLEYSRNEADKHNLGNLVEFKLLDYRNIEGQYDRIVSVGMFEHVGKEFYETFFEKINSLLKDNGIALLHTIGSLSPPGPVEPWITKYIFPGGYIPTVSEISPVIEKSRLVLSDLEILRTHYAKTLNLWKINFLDNKELVLKMFNEEFVRMWEYYLASCQYSFVYNRNVVFHAILSKKLSSVPVTRDYMYD